MLLSFDIMGEVGFGKDFNNLRTGLEHPAIKGIHDHMIVLAILSHVPWLPNIMGRIPGATAGYFWFFKWCADEIKSKQKVRIFHFTCPIVRTAMLIVLCSPDLGFWTVSARHCILAPESVH